jgi:hypothetical protein
LRFHILVEPSECAVVAEQRNQPRKVCYVVDGDDFDVIGGEGIAQVLAADAAHTVDADSDSHLLPPLRPRA